MNFEDLSPIAKLKNILYLYVKDIIEENISVGFKHLKSDVINVMNRSYVHSDHRYTFEAFASCTKPFRYLFKRKVLGYECISDKEFDQYYLKRGLCQIILVASLIFSRKN